VAVRVRFGESQLDVDRRELMWGGEPVAIEPQVFDVLAYLLRNRDRVVTKNELLDSIWGDRFVSESALTSRIKSARRAVGDTGRDQRIIRTVHGRGYRFVADVHDAPTLQQNGTSAAAGGGLVQLTAAFDALGSGSGRAIEVEAAGARSTDLLAALSETALARGLLVGRGGCEVLSGHTILGVVDAIDELVQRRQDLLKAVPAGCGVELERVLSGRLPATRQRLFVAVRELLVAGAADTGVVLLLDGLHLADRDTRGLVMELGRLTRHHPVVVVAAHRPGYRIGAPFELVDAPDAADGTVEPDATIPDAIRDQLALVALTGNRFDVLDVRAATGAGDEAAHSLVSTAAAAGAIEQVPGGYRFVDPAAADQLVEAIAPYERGSHRTVAARRLAEAGGDPARVAALYLAAGDARAAAPHALAAARQAAQRQLYAEVLRWTQAVRGLLSGEDEVAALSLRADALAGTGDSGAVAAYRQALAKASPSQAPMLRARLARAAILDGDLPSAGEALAGLEPDGGPNDGPILFARGMYAYFSGDLACAEEAAERARSLALLPGAGDRMLDVITLQGLIAHDRGEWFDRLRRELRATGENPQLAAAVFDSHLCVAEYLLYGPTPYDEVVTLAHQLRDQAERSGARRAVAFAVTVAGEAALLAGDLDTARRDLTEAIELHTATSGDTGVAHSLQRLAEVELAAGDRTAAERLLRRALPLARWSPLARHLLQRIYGSLMNAASDAATAMDVVEEAVETMDEPTACPFCQVMIAVPAAIACAEAGRLAEAKRFLTQAEASAMLWHGTAWQGAIEEARAVIAQTEGDDATADRLLSRAAALFEQAGQPLDAARCREATNA
jgi:DNA-binding winged helix-turn-helix (wHTH) protein/tetratricopeptide (TPR) repeat protein